MMMMVVVVMIVNTPSWHYLVAISHGPKVNKEMRCLSALLVPQTFRNPPRAQGGTPEYLSFTGDFLVSVFVPLIPGTDPTTFCNFVPPVFRTLRYFDQIHRATPFYPLYQTLRRPPLEQRRASYIHTIVDPSQPTSLAIIIYTVFIINTTIVLILPSWNSTSPRF